MPFFIKNLSPFNFFGLFFIISLSFSSCKEEEHKLSSKFCHNSSQNYLFLGHIYLGRDKVDPRIECLDLSCYDQIWLGGDVCAETTEEYQTLNYLDNLFNLSYRTTHWAVGNHDIRNGHVYWITQKTHRPTFYTRTFDGITLVVLNTFLRFDGVIDTINMHAQYDMLEAVCDTIQHSSHLIILSHSQMWDLIPEVADVGDAANVKSGAMLLDVAPTKTFANDLYPQLQQVANRGVQIINIAGDFGQKATAYEKMTSDGIFFLGSGITSNTSYNAQFPTNGKEDQILVLHHDLINKSIYWSFETL